MSVKVTGSDLRLSLALPEEGQTWVRQGGAMVGAAAGGGGGAAPNSQDEFIQGVSGAISPTKAHTDVEGDALDPSLFTLGAGTTDGFSKTIRITANAAGGTTITAALRVNAGTGTQPTQIEFGTIGDGALLVWQAATAKWVVRLLVGGAQLGPAA